MIAITLLCKINEGSKPGGINMIVRAGGGGGGERETNNTNL